MKFAHRLTCSDIFLILTPVKSKPTNFRCARRALISTYVRSRLSVLCVWKLKIKWMCLWHESRIHTSHSRLHICDLRAHTAFGISRIFRCELNCFWVFYVRVGAHRDTEPTTKAYIEPAVVEYTFVNGTFAICVQIVLYIWICRTWKSASRIQLCDE